MVSWELVGLARRMRGESLPTGFHLTTALNSEASWSSVQGSSGSNWGCAGAAGVGVPAGTGVSMSMASSSRVGVAVLDGVAATWVLPRPPLFLGGIRRSCVGNWINQLSVVERFRVFRGPLNAGRWWWESGNVRRINRMPSCDLLGELQSFSSPGNSVSAGWVFAGFFPGSLPKPNNWHRFCNSNASEDASHSRGQPHSSPPSP